jgi:hypothetical protein
MYYLGEDGITHHYILNVEINRTQYGTQFNLRTLMTRAQLNEKRWTIPTGSKIHFADTVPLNTEIIFTSKLNEIFGFTSGYRSDTTTNDPAQEFTEVISSVAPNINKNSVVYLNCPSIDNPYASPTSIMYSFAPLANIGDIINEKESSYVYQKLNTGIYNHLQFTLVGRNNIPLTIKDPEMSIIFNLRKVGEH